MHGQTVLIRYLQDAEAAERTFEDTLATLSKTGDQQKVQSALVAMSTKARSQHERLQARIEALGASTSTIKNALGHVFGFAPMLAQIGELPGQKSTQDLVLVIAAAAAEAAMYEALATSAAIAGDSETEQLARQLQNEERDDYRQAAAMLRESAVSTFQEAMNEKDPAPEAK